MEPVPDLTSSLEALRSVTPVTTMILPGLRSWWEGALDVEGLALGSVLAAATALEALTGCAGRYSASSEPVAASFDSLTHLRIAGTKPQGFAPASGFRRTSDGWIRLHANYPHHAARLMEAMGANSAQDVDDALLTMTSLDAEDATNANRGVATAVRRRGEWSPPPCTARSLMNRGSGFSHQPPCRCRQPPHQFLLPQPRGSHPRTLNGHSPACGFWT